MPTEIRVPQLGESVVEAVVGTWLKKEGDPVQPGDALVELETDKVNVEITAEQGGVLQQILKPEGETVGVGEVIGAIAEGAGAAVPAPAAQPSAAAAAAGPTPTPTVPAAPAPTAPEPVGAGPRATPAVRRLAAEHDVDLSQVPAGGDGGRVTREDVLGYVQRLRQPQPAAPAANGVGAVPPPAPAARPAAPATAAPTPAFEVATDGRREERIRMTRRRQTIAERLVEAQHTAAMLTTFNEVDMSAVMALRARRRDAFKERHGVGLGYMSFFTKAAVGALKAFPNVNAEVQGNEIVRKHYYDVGIAVGTEEGLVVPVVRDADRKSFAEIEREVADLATKARERRLALEELMGGTFTITNGGIYGSLLSTPILNPPQVGILGMHKIEKRPVVVGDQVVVRPMMYLALSYDHRVVDGSEAVQFLVRVKELIEDPETLLLEG
ncbi:MAG TPA: 2-oxoglutarate dehydrogenase complex dihydrolipoyllysine-residue succinyltransferase [Thermomicrobiaceae bacterium]|nr:2-oxoglutarate dehydrogenase complex dihydrolipoyllysine-residue succinyltransferase [Thermomicrobiaceae bacterium]